ncbi:MAG: prepilin-type N-terminal cleavage/methylation domain-containing protein [Candidatus Magasanikbacteria bacterium]|nr:prepilin-type N-terminal cleavage/methylation domain-containing protein [Candidatus Magasanikbacteria bacterium]
MFNVKNNKGFTLIETMFAIGIFSIIIFGIFSLFNVSFKADRDIQGGGAVQNESSKVVQSFIDELRTANYSTVGSFPVTLANSTEIIFYSNIDADNLMERVRYFVDGDVLKKGVTKPTGDVLYSYNTSTEQTIELVHNLKTPIETIFTYFDENYNGADSVNFMTYPIILPDIRMVGITLQIKQNTALNAKIFEVKTKVQLRNLKTN